MVIGPDFTTTAKPHQYGEIDALLKAAFGRPDEAELVERLRADGDIWSEMVTPLQGVIAGYAALSRMRSPDGWACLGPVAVIPRMQNGALAPRESLRRPFAVGTGLVSMLALAANSGMGERHENFPTTIVVSGRPNFFARAGFSSERALQLISPHPAETMLIARPGDDIPEEMPVYPPAFDQLR